MPRKTPPSDPDTPLLEWICGGVGLVLFLGVLAITTINGFSKDEPPSFEIGPPEIRTDAQGRYQVAFNVFNRGDKTAEAVSLEVRLESQGQVVETREVEIDFLPPHSGRGAVAMFEVDPRSLAIEIEPQRYRLP